MLLIEYVGHIGLRSLTDGHLGRHLEYFKTLNDARVASVGFIKYNASTTRINKEKNFKIKFQVILVFYRTIMSQIVINSQSWSHFVEIHPAVSEICASKIWKGQDHKNLINSSSASPYFILVQVWLKYATGPWDIAYSQTCAKQPLSKRHKIGFQDQLSLNACQKYCRMVQREHSAILLTFI